MSPIWNVHYNKIAHACFVKGIRTLVDLGNVNRRSSCLPDMLFISLFQKIDMGKRRFITKWTRNWDTAHYTHTIISISLQPCLAKPLFTIPFPLAKTSRTSTTAILTSIYHKLGTHIITLNPFTMTSLYIITPLLSPMTELHNRFKDCESQLNALFLPIANMFLAYQQVRRLVNDGVFIIRPPILRSRHIHCRVHVSKCNQVRRMCRSALPINKGTSLTLRSRPEINPTYHTMRCVTLDQPEGTNVVLDTRS